jgi:polyisoprenoid-binding protein YceI
MNGAKWLGAAAALILSASSAAAEIKEFKLDRTHSFIGFEIDHWGFSRTVGRFNDYAGRVLIDDDNPSNSTVEVVIKTASLDTGFASRDEYVRKAEFLDVARFPTMVFRSISAEVAPDRRRGRLVGDLTLHGVTKPVTIAFELVKTGRAPHPDYRNVEMAGLRASAQIKRSDFGMTFAIPGVGDIVDLTFHLEIVRCVGEGAQAPSCRLS